MRNSYLLSLSVASLLLSGCGSSSDTTDSGTNTVGAVTTITVERGPVLKAAVVDANGQVARDDGNGKYTFSSAPVYPVMATGGIIDMNRDGQVSVGDVVSDLNLTTTAGSVITVATTLASNPATKPELERMAADLNLSTADLLSKTPSESKEIEAISNIAYKFMKDNNITNLQNSRDQKLVDLNISAEVHTEYQVYVNDSSHDSQQKEKELMDSIVLTNTNALNHLDSTEVESEISRLDAEHENLDTDAIKNDLRSLKSEYESEYGDLDYEDEGSDVNHYQGRACASCHSSATASNLAPARSDELGENEGTESESGENIFDSGATIFTSINAVDNSALKAASNYSLRLVLEGGAKEVYRIGRGTGNVNASFNAGIANYTAEVLDRSGNVVNSSLTNSHNAARFDCNSCHTATGTNGAPGRIVSFEYSAPVDVNTTTTTTTTTPTDTNTSTTTTTVVVKSFVNDVLPILNTNCKSCHGSNGNFSITSSATPYAGVTPFVNMATPIASKLLTKASGVSHGGGTVLSSSSAEYTTLRDWINEGATNN